MICFCVLFFFLFVFCFFFQAEDGIRDRLVTGVQTCALPIYLVQAIGYHLIKLGYVVRYRSIFDVVRDFLHDEAMDGHERIMEGYLKPDLLIIDDFGMKQLPKRSGEYLFEIVMRRHETRSTMMTTNRPIEDWGKLLGDVPTASAILDRFLHHSEVITITGKSYRLRSRVESAKPAKAPPGSEKVEKAPKPAKAPPGSNADQEDEKTVND